ncbi:hypothetical protein EC968_009117 [Mortierella alpina]|nr:hypothetical protein EC968_009117 [Mortierella alpina]
MRVWVAGLVKNKGLRTEKWMSEEVREQQHKTQDQRRQLQSRAAPKGSWRRLLGCIKVPGCQGADSASHYDMPRTCDGMRSLWGHLSSLSDMGLLFEDLKKIKAAMVSDEITEVEEELRHHFLAADKLVQDGRSHDQVDAKYLEMFSRYYNEAEMKYYRRFYSTWISNVQEEMSLKRHLSSIPIVRDFIWMEWRDVNVAMGGLVKQILMLNYPNQELYDVALVSSAITYTSIQCGLLNDVGSFIKDKNSPEINYFIDVSPTKAQDQDAILEAAIQYYHTLDLPSHLKLVMKSAVYGSYLLYRLSNRFLGRSRSNW